MTVLSLTDPVAGTLADATLIANNDAAIKAVINGGIDNNNFAAGKIFDNTKIMQGGATTGQALAWNGTSWVPTTVAATTYRKMTAKAVTNTVADTDLLNAEITAAANALGANGVLRLFASGDWIQNSGAGSALPRFKVKLGAGATVVLDTGAPATPVLNGASRFGWEIEVKIANLGATNSQWVSIRGLIGYTSGNVGNAGLFTVGEGTYQSLIYSVGGATSTEALFIGGNTAAIDTTAAMAVVLSVINPTATPTCETKLLFALAEVL